MSRCRCLVLHRFSTNSRASQSNKAGCVGGVPILPKLSRLLTMPRPKWCFHTRFTQTRAVSGCSGLAIHCARAKRLPVLLDPTTAAGLKGFFENTAGKAAFTNGPGLPRLPRRLTYVGEDSPRSHSARISGSDFFFALSASIFFFSSPRSLPLIVLNCSSIGFSSASILVL